VRWGAVVDNRWTVPVAAALAFLLRLPGLTRPIRPDEAGWFIVARTWDPSAGSVYGEHFVDRPPSLIGLVDLADHLGGPVALRVLGAIAAAAMVLLAGRIGRLVATDTAGRWSAVTVAALTTSPLIDPVAAKGELLALPLLGLAMLGALQSVEAATHHRAALLAFAAGISGAAALGLKQNLVGGLVFAAVLFVCAFRWGPSGPQRLGLQIVSFGAGVAVPVLATATWALAAGVRLSELWYTVYGFRSDAAEVLAQSTSTKPAERIALLAAIALGAGVVAILGGFVVHFPQHWASERPVAVATGAVLVVEVAGLVISGSYWRDYLFPLVPPLSLCVVLLVSREGPAERRMRAVSALSVVSAAVAMVVWFVLELVGAIGYTEVAAGDAIEQAAGPGDTLTVFGGRADVQYASGLDSPYPHLWSLPMRTLDPQYDDLVALLDGPEAPTWFVTWIPLTSWDAPGADDLARVIEENYARHGTGCDDNAVYLLRGVERSPITPDC
jgi:hypothetical protein